MVDADADPERPPEQGFEVSPERFGLRHQAQSGQHGAPCRGLASTLVEDRQEPIAEVRCDPAVMDADDIACRREEAIQRMDHVVGEQPLAERRETADVGSQDRNFTLHPHGRPHRRLTALVGQGAVIVVDHKPAHRHRTARRRLACQADRIAGLKRIDELGLLRGAFGKMPPAGQHEHAARGTPRLAPACPRVRYPCPLGDAEQGFSQVGDDGGLIWQKPNGRHVGLSRRALGRCP